MVTRAKTQWTTAALGVLASAVLVLVSCTPDFFPSHQGTATSNSSKQRESLHLNDYISVCEQELGAPAEPVRIPEIDCFASHMKEIDPQRTASDGRCHRPSGLLGAYSLTDNAGQDACASGSRIGRIDDEDVTWVMVCRKYGEHKDPRAFDDMNLIGWNRETGKTCFFNSLVTGETTKEPIVAAVPLNVYEQGEKTFMTPKQIRDVVPCVKCHSANAFLRTSHISNAVSLPPLTRKSSYHLVHPEIVAPFLREGESTRITPDEVPAVKACTSCHAVGRAEYCKTYVPLAWGVLDPKLSYGASKRTQSYRESLWHRDVLPALGNPDLKPSELPAGFRQALSDLEQHCVTVSMP